MLRTFCADISRDLLSDIKDESVDVVITSPPYKEKDGWSTKLMHHLGRLLNRIMKPGARCFFNFGQLRESPIRPYYSNSLIMIAGDLKLSQTIAWVKSITIDGKQRGHYQPLNSDKILNYCWEPIFVLYKEPEMPIDRLSIGVPYVDKGNLSRGTRGQHGDLHCAGDVWFLPHSTTGSSNKKDHPHSYPPELVIRCLKLSGIPTGAVVFDPFCGGGTTAKVALSMGYSAITSDINKERLQALWDSLTI